jgi:hypothetical protein
VKALQQVLNAQGTGDKPNESQTKQGPLLPLPAGQASFEAPIRIRLLVRQYRLPSATSDSDADSVIHRFVGIRPERLKITPAQE